ncbi:MAG: adenosylcobinamide-phosphate synthase CbiB [Tabrizicola sp.]|uniref:adenosylcobinamide-phosphate synthase CbiB n=1 Tax=Tabrizicola sp. TaxID=2005166 RepID=UPI002734BE9D|nr:adenosylcobinamide-phosphate synthase CbiB [Tabrizicola sp.]MDP3262657.1 adenosylcobinamide-phosphate synthase CbiB [Tabrizicola sp.]MDP3647817.1 adenosylcobinamide-phosphate synthase CbiB [Paracoccaceae bacterium]MDZ4069273.1 adenosylcobinamide-phosphate synthase CbiB [Tabrizicola sp.]
MILITAMLLDAALGEPKAIWDRIPHPAVLMGRLIAGLDARFNRGESRRLKGTLAAAALGLGALVTGWLVHALPDHGVIETLVVAVLLAQKSLVDHVRAVATALRRSLPEGRAAVAMIVGRDTADMSEPDVARAAIESAAENLSDGVIAPIFWYLVLGLPGLLLYKVANTADSMIGHLTPRHAAFGWASARFDDLLNLIPARLTALLIALTHGWVDPTPILRDAPLHRSPNAGWPEAAIAPVLNVALSGPRSYNGVRRHYPWVWPEGRRDPGPDDIDATCAALWRTWAAMLAIAVLVALF